MRILYERPIVLSADLMANRTYRRREERPRSPGVHVQAVNRTLAIAAGKLDPTQAMDGFDGGKYPLLPALGVAWEDFRASIYSESELLWQPFELERDGIYGNPDGLWIAEPETAIWECKLTTKRRCSVADCWMYLKQGLAYCAMSGQKRVLFDVCWLYRPYEPEGSLTLVEFEEREIETWWKNIVKVASSVLAEN